MKSTKMARMVAFNSADAADRDGIIFKLIVQNWYFDT